MIENLPRFLDLGTLQKLFEAGFPSSACTGKLHDGSTFSFYPTSDDLAGVIDKLVPYIKIRKLPIGYFKEGMQEPDGTFSEEPRPFEGEQWGAAFADGGDYTWKRNLWCALADAYLRIQEKLTTPTI